MKNLGIDSEIEMVGMEGKILGWVKENQNREISLFEMAQKTQIPGRIIYKILIQLEDQKVIMVLRNGANRIIRIQFKKII